LAIADDIIENDGDIAVTRDQVGGLHSRYLALAENRAAMHD
jgi:dephospho-CoA kinase